MLPGRDPHPGWPLADEVRRKGEALWRVFAWVRSTYATASRG